MTFDDKITACIDEAKDTYKQMLELSRTMRTTLGMMKDLLYQLYDTRCDDDNIDDLPFKS